IAGARRLLAEELGARRVQEADLRDAVEVAARMVERADLGGAREGLVRAVVRAYLRDPGEALRAIVGADLGDADHRPAPVVRERQLADADEVSSAILGDAELHGTAERIGEVSTERD